MVSHESNFIEKLSPTSATVSAVSQTFAEFRRLSPLMHERYVCVAKFVMDEVTTPRDHLAHELLGNRCTDGVKIEY